MKQVLDQAAHFGVAFLVCLLLDPLQGIAVGFALGMVREVTEEGDPVTFVKIIAALRSWRDLTFWTLGGLAGGML